MQLAVVTLMHINNNVAEVLWSDNYVCNAKVAASIPALEA